MPITKDERLHRQAMAEALGSFPLPTVYEAAGKRGDMAPSIRPIVAGNKLAGLAVTVRLWPGDTLGVFHAVDRAPAGSVLVVDAGGGDRVVVWGATLSLACIARGIRGCVTNGCVRDVAEMEELGFPVFAAGICPRGIQRVHPGWHDLAISVGDVVVNSGDIVLGDRDGVLVLPGAEAADLLDRTRLRHAQEIEWDARARAGEKLSAVFDLPPE